jgi:hypothetical protein
MTAGESTTDMSAAKAAAYMATTATAHVATAAATTVATTATPACRRVG